MSPHYHPRIVQDLIAARFSSRGTPSGNASFSLRRRSDRGGKLKWLLLLSIPRCDDQRFLLVCEGWSRGCCISCEVFGTGETSMAILALVNHVDGSPRQQRMLGTVAESTNSPSSNHDSVRVTAIVQLRDVVRHTAMSPSSPITQNSHITPPSSFTAHPLTPPPTNEKPFAQVHRVIALFKEIQAGNHTKRDP